MSKFVVANLLAVCVAMIAMFTPGLVVAAETKVEVPAAQVGVAKTVRGVVIEGPVVRSKANSDSMTPVVVRVLSSEPVSGGYKYDLEFYALEPGEHDLSNYLERTADGAAVPAIMVSANSSLSDPNAIELRGQILRAASWFPWYTVMVGLTAVGWCAGLWWILTSGKKAVSPEHQHVVELLTPIEELEARVRDRESHQLNNTEQAELERLVYQIWRELKGIDADAAAAVLSLKGDPQAGVMLRKFEEWLHAPKGRSVELSEILKELRERVEVAAV